MLFVFLGEQTPVVQRFIDIQNRKKAKVVKSSVKVVTKKQDEFMLAGNIELDRRLTS